MSFIYSKHILKCFSVEYGLLLTSNLRSRSFLERTLQKTATNPSGTRTFSSECLSKTEEVLNTSSQLKSFANVRVTHALNEYDKYLNQNIRVKGWVKSSMRIHKGSTFFDIHDGLGGLQLQVVVNNENVHLCETLKQLNFHSAVSVDGELVKSCARGQIVELVADQLHIINNTIPAVSNENEKVKDIDDSESETENSISERCSWYPYGYKHQMASGQERQNIHFRPKLNHFAALLRLRSHLNHLTHLYFKQNDFTFINTPILTSNDCEGAGDIFNVVKPGHPDFFSSSNPEKDAINLTVSAQMHLECVANGISRVYTVSPTFRAESGKSKRHLAEFTMVEAEIALLEENEMIQDVCSTVESYIRYMCNSMLNDDKCLDDIETYVNSMSRLMGKGVRQDLKATLDKLNCLLETPFVYVTHAEALEALKIRDNPSHNLSREDEQRLCKLLLDPKKGGGGVFVTDWPVDLKPFYAKRKADGQLTHTFDLLMPQVGEVCGGSLRIFDFSDVNSSDIPTKLEWYRELRTLGGSSPTGGFGFGFDRFVQYVLNVNSIFDVVPFPRYSGYCAL